MRQLANTYNCVLATVYNYIADIYDCKYPIEAMYIVPSILELGRVDGFLSTSSPEYVVRNFLESINAELSFPDMKTLDEAIAFADEHLQQKGVMPVNINLRYDILEPLPFDNDYWHFHLMVERISSKEFRMFDQFENEYYIVSEEHLKKAIDTEFNYSMSSGFSPFMLVHIPEEQQTPAFQKLKSQQIGWKELKAVMEHYPLQHNIQEGLMFLDEFNRFQKKKPDAEEKYRILNYTLIIAKSREAYIECLDKIFNISNSHQKAAQDIYSVHQRWMEFRNTLGMVLARGKAEGFMGLEDYYKALIQYEYDTFNRVLDWAEANCSIENR